MNYFLVMVEIGTFTGEFKTYFLLKCTDRKEAQEIVDKYLRDRGNTEPQFDYSMSFVEQLSEEEVSVFERYINFYPTR